MPMEPRNEGKQENQPAYEPPRAVALSGTDTDGMRGCGDGQSPRFSCGNGTAAERCSVGSGGAG